MDKKIVLILSSIASMVLLTSLWVTTVQSGAGGRDAAGFTIPADWHQTSSSLILNESWSWDWTPSGTVPWPEGIILYKKTGDTIFFTPYPPIPGSGMSMLIANRVGPMTWRWQGGEMVAGGPNMDLMMFNGTVTVTFTWGDVPLTDDDNDYRGLRLVVEVWMDLYELEDVSADQYVWHGLKHVHIIFWAPKGRRA